MTDVVVVGSGLSGLSVARGLAEHGVDVTLVERLPACGGQEPEHPRVDDMTRAAIAAGVTVLCGTMAVAWDGESLSTLGVDGARRLAASVLVVATGTRPATAGELLITGDRCAGVLPGSAALHLVEGGVLPGRRPTVLGGGSLARSCAEALMEAGATSITLIAPDGLHFHAPAHARVYSGWTVGSVHGASRVAALTITSGESHERVLADALILSHRRIPMRNVEGAVLSGPRIVFCQNTGDPKREDELKAGVTRAIEDVSTIVSRSRRPAPTVALRAEVKR